MIPPLIKINNCPWEVLPPGIHQATLSDIERVFANNSHRKMLFQGLVQAAYSLYQAGCSYIYLDGSYVTSKPNPEDYDVCWDFAGVIPEKLENTFLDLSSGTKNQKERFKGEFYPNIKERSSGLLFVDFFQRERHSGSRKGIIGLMLNEDTFQSVMGD